MASGSFGPLFHWGKTVPSGIHITPSEICFAAAALILFVFYIRMKMRFNEAEAARILARSHEAAWNERDLKLGVIETFKDVQDAWGKGDFPRLHALLERKLYQEWQLRKAEADMADGTRETVSDVTVNEVEIVNAKDFFDNSKDEFTARISFNATEAVIRSGTETRIENGVFVEYWKMARLRDQWKVREIMRDGLLVRMSLALDPSFLESGKDGARG